MAGNEGTVYSAKIVTPTILRVHDSILTDVNKKTKTLQQSSRTMAAKKKHAPSVLLTEEENSVVREILGQKKYVSYLYLNGDSLLFYVLLLWKQRSFLAKYHYALEIAANMIINSVNLTSGVKVKSIS